MLEEVVYVVINESHNLFPAQKELLDRFFESWNYYLVPEAGWTYEEILTRIHNIFGLAQNTKYIKRIFVFASPIPSFMVILSNSNLKNIQIRCFHNDKREAVEINGKIIHKVSETGWIIV